MTIEEVYEELCSYDTRNPFYGYITSEDDDPRPPRTNCFCDNCFYGRDKLALEILRLKGGLS